MTGLTTASDATTQLALDDKPTGWREAERAMDRITQRFGAGAVRPAVLVDGERDQSQRDQGQRDHRQGLGHRPSGYRESSPESG
jgi:DNA polymerase-4